MYYTRWVVYPDGKFTVEKELPLQTVAAKVLELRREGNYIIN